MPESEGGTEVTLTLDSAQKTAYNTLNKQQIEDKMQNPGDLTPYEAVNKTNLTFMYLCACGKTHKDTLAALQYGAHHSCGCKNTPLSSPSTSIHNKYQKNVWYVNSTPYKSKKHAADILKVSEMTINYWCLGRKYASGRFTPPKTNCYVKHLSRHASTTPTHWVVDSIPYPSPQIASKAFGVSRTTIYNWCLGRKISSNPNKYSKPSKNCYIK